MCNIAQMVNVLQSVLLTDGFEGKRCVRTANYFAFQLFKPHRSKTAVRVETDAARFDPAARRAPGQPEPPPEYSVSASKRGGELVVTFVNPRHDVDMQIDCAVRGVSATQGRAQILHDSDMNAYNSFDDPNRLGIKSHEVAVEGARVRLTLPALSVATVTLQVAS
jgi:alpha-N-arabinofuranosidase